ncbi:MAG: hypothetical protein CMH28_06745 [Micavibrio sp.]|nr:hypothetical protein [Micavibrio sp.]
MSVNLDKLKTEAISESAKGMDTLPTLDLLKLMMVSQKDAVKAVKKNLPDIEKAVKAAAAKLEAEDGVLRYVGSGTSGRLGLQDGIELAPTFGWPLERVGVAMSGGKQAIIKAMEGAEDDRDAAVKDLEEAGFSKHDVVIALSASGRTPYVVSAAEHAGSHGALTIGISNNDGSPLQSASQFAFYLDTSPEPIGGSTRMSAGTSQKIILNLITSAIMFELGYVSRGQVEGLIKSTDGLRESKTYSWKPSTRNFLDMMLESQEHAVNCLDEALPSIAKAADAVAVSLNVPDAKLVCAGAGTTARTGTQDFVELQPTFGWPLEKVSYLIAGGEESLTTPLKWVGLDADEGVAHVRDENLSTKDVFVLASISGYTTYTLAIEDYARDTLKACTVAIANSEDSPLLKNAQYPILLSSSDKPTDTLTRLGSGTAQKVAFNLFSSAVMVRRGHVYDGYMVDVQLNNEKLVERALRMVEAITGCNRKEAERVLNLSGEGKHRNVKKAVLIHYGINTADVEEYLNTHGGNLRRALRALKQEKKPILEL